MAKFWISPYWRESECVCSNNPQWIRFYSFVFYSAHRIALDSIVRTRSTFYSSLSLCIWMCVCLSKHTGKMLKIDRLQLLLVFRSIVLSFFFIFFSLSLSLVSRMISDWGAWMGNQCSRSHYKYKIHIFVLFCLVSFPSLLCAAYSSWFCSDFHFLLNSNKSKWPIVLFRIYWSVVIHSFILCVVFCCSPLESILWSCIYSLYRMLIKVNSSVLKLNRVLVFMFSAAV